MRIINLILLSVVILLPVICGKEENINKVNVENLKILRKSVNFAYIAGNNFLDLIRGSTPPDKIFDNAMEMAERNSFKLSEIIPLYLPYVGYISLLLMGLIFVLIVPIVGFCFCCCRCAGKCGGRIKSMDPKHATCKRYTYALFLGIITIVQLAGIVLAFINNQLIHDTLTNPSDEISAIRQLQLGTDLMKASLKNITVAIKESERSSRSNGDVEINKTNFLELTCNRYLSVMRNDTNKLNIDADLSKILSKLRDSVKYLSQDKTRKDKLESYSSYLQKEIGKLKVDSIVPQICEILSNAANSDFTDLKGLMRGQIKEGSTIGAKLQGVVHFINNTGVIFMDVILENFKEYMKVDYLEYRMYICIGICCLLLLIVLFYFLGLCFGQCGERPFEDARICNRGVGANLMMAGVAFAFLFTPTIMMIEISLFMYGGMTQTDLCRYATNSTEPGVHTYDTMLRRNPALKDNIYTKNNIIDSIINRCPSESMAMAFHIDKKLISEDISRKIVEISAKVEKVPWETKVKIVDKLFKNVDGLLSNISSQIVDIIKGDSYFDEQMKQIIIDKFTSISKEISVFSLSTIKEKFKNSFDNAAKNGFEPGLRIEVQTLLNKIYLKSYENVRCNGIHDSAVTIINATCVTFLWPFNGFWYGVGICLIFTIPAIIFAVKLAGLYRHTEKYSSDYEEPDYHSYMGFYTNNADNIPMKRPKTAKSNSKNRNSNSNNKESLKQNNPQYLPVYPYDAYE